MMHDHHLRSPLNHHLQTINYDTGSKSTKGASKMRRDSINHEINKLRDLLPIPASARQRLSQLQLMALILVYVRKTNYFEKLYKTLGLGAKEKNETTTFGFAKALDGFMLIITQTGRILYISENAAEYLGHSMEDLLIHGDSIYDIVDKQDHPTLHVHLNDKEEPTASSDNLPKSTKAKKQIFLCRINVSRNARRQMRFGDQKVILVKGHFYSDLPLCSRDEPVFVAWCTPLAMPENREIVVQGATNVFTTVHSLDMKIIEVDDNGERHLGYSRQDLLGVSFYHMLHPDSMRELQAKHRLVTGAESDKSSILLIRLQRENGTFIWVHSVMQIKDSSEESQVPVIICTNQILSEEEAGVMRANSWLYHYYMVQSRLQYGLAYGAHSPAGLAAYYPHMLGGAGQPPQGYSPYDPAAHSPISPAYLSAAAGGHHTGFTAATATSLYPGYHLYSPAATPHYHLPPQTEHAAAHLPAPAPAHRDTKDHGPLDFSKDYSSRSQDYNSSQQSSPSLRSDTSSSPVYHPPHESLYGAPEVAVLTQAGRHASISDHHYKAHHRSLTDTQTRHRDHIIPGASTNPIGFWSDTSLSGFEKYKAETDPEHDRVKRVKKETDYYNSDSNNNSDGPPTYYSLDQLHLQQHH